MAELRKVDVVYFLKIRELNNIFCRQVDDASAISRLDQHDWQYIKGESLGSPPAQSGQLDTSYQELARQEKQEIEALTARGMTER